jgi:hypothetical protein
VHLGHRQALAGDADETYEAFLPRLEGAVRAQSGLPLDHVDQIVQLNRVHLVYPEAVERAADLFARGTVADQRAVLSRSIRGTSAQRSNAARLPASWRPIPLLSSVCDVLEPHRRHGVKR